MGKLEDPEELFLLLASNEIPSVASDNNEEAEHHPTSSFPAGGCGCRDNDNCDQNEHDGNCDKKPAKDVHDSDSSACYDKAITHAIYKPNKTAQEKRYYGYFVNSISHGPIFDCSIPDTIRDGCRCFARIPVPHRRARQDIRPGS